MVTAFLAGDAHYTVASNGTLIYVAGGADDVSRSFVWVDRRGAAEPLPFDPRGFEVPRLSPDGQSIAVTIREGTADVWVVGLQRGTVTRTAR